jgi:hypothetical protein
MTVPMNAHNFLYAMGIGSALIAFWIALRFPNRGPANFQRALIHVVAALAVGWVTPLFTGPLIAGGYAPALAAFFAVLLPALVYTFLSGAWFLRLAQQRIGQHR